LATGGPITDYEPNPLNQYSQITVGNANPVSPIHDLDGNLVNDGTKVYVWDAENRLSEVRRASDNELIASYRYDSMSRRIRKTTTEFAPQGADDRVFVYDGWNLLCEYEVTSNQLALDRAYTWGPDLSGSLQGAGGVGGLLAVDEKDGSSVHSPLYDGNGNVLGLVQGTASTPASVSATYDYDAFGNTVFENESGAVENPFRFSTKYFDKETGFYYYGYRYYDPVTGRWPSRDPIQEKGGLNLYRFVGNDGINRLDILGERVIKVDRCEAYLYIGHYEAADPVSFDLNGKCAIAGAVGCYPNKMNPKEDEDTKERRQQEGDAYRWPNPVWPGVPNHDKTVEGGTTERGKRMTEQENTARGLDDNHPEGCRHMGTAVANALQASSIKKIKDDLCGKCCCYSIKITVEVGKDKPLNDAIERAVKPFFFEPGEIKTVTVKCP
jgi:RHS repeat-associated protein